MVSLKASWGLIGIWAENLLENIGFNASKATQQCYLATKQESAMATFLAIEEDMIPIIVEFSKFLLTKIHLKLRINKQ